MTERALSEAGMLASLRDIRLPAEAAGGVGADLAAAVAVAGLVALLLTAGLRALTLRQAAAPQDGLDALAMLPEADRRIALLHLLRACAPDRYRAVARDLYRRDTRIDLKRLEDEIVRAKPAARRRGWPVQHGGAAGRA